MSKERISHVFVFLSVNVHLSNAVPWQHEARVRMFGKVCALEIVTIGSVEVALGVEGARYKKRS